MPGIWWRGDWQEPTGVLHGLSERGGVGAPQGGWRAFSPLVSDLIIAPDSSFIGE